jgi:hypothetical protein
MFDKMASEKIRFPKPASWAVLSGRLGAETLKGLAPQLTSGRQMGTCLVEA